MRLWNLLPRSEVLVSRLQRAYRYSELRKLQLWLKGRSLHWAIYLTLVSVFVGGLLSLHNYASSFYYVVWVNEYEVGLVQDAEEVEQFLDDLMDKSSILYGMEVYPQQDINLTWEYRRDKEADLEHAKQALRQHISLITEAVMVVVNGIAVVPVSTEKEVESVIELVSLSYISQDNNVTLLEVELVEEISGERYVTSPEEVYSAEQVAYLLTRHDLYQQPLMASSGVMISRSGRNEPDIELESEIPLVHVRTVEESMREERIPFSTTYTNNSNMFIGQSRVTTSGVDGRKEVTYRITRENGEEISREALSTKVVKEPVTQVVERGTGRRFTWPVSGGGRITQSFRGVSHRGIDIAAAHGTPILAAESGVVVKSENVWPMGNYIVLNNGEYWTVYLHNSRNIVSVGQQVSRGQTIAYLGSTGRSTGPHLHFEVRRSNGSGVWSSWTAHPAIDPMQFFR